MLCFVVFCSRVIQEGVTSFNLETSLCESCELLASYLVVCCGHLEYTCRVARQIVPHLISSHDPTTDGKTAYENRFRAPLDRPVIHVGAKIAYKPITHKDDFLLHQFGVTLLRGMLLGSALHAGRGKCGRREGLDW